MQQIEPWVAWAVLAIVLLLSEIFLPAFFIFFFGLGAIPAAVAAALGASLTVQVSVFVAVSAVGLVFARKFALKLTQETPQNIGSNRMVGKQGIIIEDLVPNDAKGKIRVERDVWIAESESGELIPEGTRVKVLRIDGTRLIVETAEEAGSDNKPE